MPFASSVPTTMKSMFPQKPDKYYRDLERVVDTLDSIGTKAASPTHLIYENRGKHDYGHIESRVSHIWKSGKGSGGGGGGGSAGRGGRGRTGRRPSEYLLEGMLAAQKRGAGGGARGGARGAAGGAAGGKNSNVRRKQKA